MHHVCKPKLRFLGLLAIVFAAIIVPSAAAYPVLQDESNFVAQNTTKAPLVIPYLSHGVGVDASRYSGARSTPMRLVIPYLSHGKGVDESLYSGTPALSHTQDAERSFVGSTSDSDAFERAVDRHALLIKGLNATARSAAATRPDDRAGIHGIGG
ncbi:MAG TPA: hypothetical protein VH538_03235 [Gaiellaceae bacterium]|jgi:hypothetical protein